MYHDYQHFHVTYSDFQWLNELGQPQPVCVCRQSSAKICWCRLAMPRGCLLDWVVPHGWLWLKWWSVLVPSGCLTWHNMANIPVDIVSERFISIQGNRLRFLIKNNSIFHCHDCRPGCLRIPNGMLSLRNLYKSRQMVGSCFFPSCQLRHPWIGTYWTSWPGSCLSQDEMTPTQPFIF